MINFYRSPQRYLIPILLVSPKRLQLKDNLRGENRRKIYLEGTNPRTSTLKTTCDIVSRVVVLEDHLCSEIDRFTTFLFDE